MRANLPHLVSFAFLVVVTAVGRPAGAHQYSYLIENEYWTSEGLDQYQTIKFAVYIEPDKTNWVGWSSADRLMTSGGADSIGGPEGGHEGVSDYVVLTLIDPYGHQSSPYNLDRNDALGNPIGPQAMFYGDQEAAPRVVRFNFSGEPSTLSEGGVATEFIDNNGLGYYVFNLTCFNEFGDTRGHGDMFLLIDVVEGYRQKDPIMYRDRGGDLPGFVAVGGADQDGGGSGSSFFGFNDDDDDDDDDNNNNNDRRVPTPTPGPGEEPGEPNPPPPIPEEPTEPEEPVIPEPATVALIGLGLAATGVLSLRRRVKR